jgi:hypothetical protein
MTKPTARLCARPGCGRYADCVVKLHRNDGRIGVIHVCDEDATLLESMATARNVPVTHKGRRRNG